MSVLSSLKKALLPAGRHWRTIKLGPAKGIRMQLDLSSQTQRLLGLDEQELFAPLRKLMPQCRSMVDVGANDGYYTLIFLRSPAERIVACEGGPMTRLIENAAANGFEPGDRFSMVNNLIGPGSTQTPLQKVIQNLPGPILIKLDVEGAEWDVLESCLPFDRLSDLRFIVETHSLELEEKCQQWFADHGFDSSIIPNASWRWLLPETRLVAHNRWLVAVPQKQN